MTPPLASPLTLPKLETHLWETLSPDPILEEHRNDYRWLPKVYEAVKRSTGNGRLIRYALGAKTAELLREKVHVGEARDDQDELVVDADVLEAIMGSPDRNKTSKELDIKITARLRKHMGKPRFTAPSERLEALRELHAQGLLNSVEFRTEHINLAHALVAAENDTSPDEDQDRGTAALTELSQQVRNEKTPVMVERVVADINAIVRLVRFPGWQHTSAGELEMKKALRKGLLKYQLHQDTELFEKAYGYVVQYY